MNRGTVTITSSSADNASDYAHSIAKSGEPHSTFYQVFTGTAAPFGRSRAALVTFRDGLANTFLTSSWRSRGPGQNRPIFLMTPTSLSPR